MGPRPKGDPAAILETASYLKRAASSLEVNVGVSQLELPGAAFMGPARACLDGGIADMRSCARTAAATLREEAASLASEAAELKTAQKAWDRQAKEEREAREERERERTAPKLTTPTFA